MKKDSAFWGVILVLAAVYIIINNLGFMPDINIVRLAIAIICLIVFFKALVKIEFGGMLFSAAILLILFDEQLGIEQITPWPVLFAALFGSLGLNMIFGNRTETYKKSHNSYDYGKAEYVSGDEVMVHAMFNGCKKTISSDNFTKAIISCKFGGMEISFDDAVIQSGRAVVQLDVSFAGVELYIPQSWRVENHTEGMFAGFEEHRSHSDGEGPTVVFEGNVRFAGVEIYRI